MRYHSRSRTRPGSLPGELPELRLPSGNARVGVHPVGFGARNARHLGNRPSDAGFANGVGFAMAPAIPSAAFGVVDSGLADGLFALGSLVDLIRPSWRPMPHGLAGRQRI